MPKVLSCPAKYNLRELIAAMPGRKQTNRYRLCIELDISESTLYNWCYYPKNGRWSIPSDKLFKLAQIFNCDYTKLING